MDLFNKVHIIEPMKSHIYEPNINSLISLIRYNLMFNYANPGLLNNDQEFHILRKKKILRKHLGVRVYGLITYSYFKCIIQ